MLFVKQSYALLFIISTAKADNFINPTIENEVLLRALLPAQHLSWSQYRQWGESFRHNSVNIVLYHPDLEKELINIQSSVADFLSQKDSFMCCMEISYNISCVSEFCNSDMCNFQFQCHANYCLIGNIPVTESLICNISVTVQTGNGLQVAHYKEIMKSEQNQTHTPLPLLLVQKNNLQIAYLIDAETGVALGSHSNLNYNTDGYSQDSQNQEFINKLNNLCLDMFSQIKYGVLVLENGSQSLIAISKLKNAKDNISILYQSPSINFGSILCFPLQSRIVWTETSDNRTWNIESATVKAGRNFVFNISANQNACWNNKRIMSKALAHYWPTAYASNPMDSFLFVTEDGIWRASIDGLECSVLMSANWRNHTIRSIGADWSYVYYVNDEGKLFQWSVRTTNLGDLARANVPFVMQGCPNYEEKQIMLDDVHEIRTYGPEQWPLVPEGCFQLFISNLSINQDQISVEFHWNDSIDCQQISHPAIKVSILFYERNCTLEEEDPNDCSYDVSIGPTFDMSMLMDFPANLRDNVNYTITTRASVVKEARFLLSHCDKTTQCILVESQVWHVTSKADYSAYWKVTIIVALTAVLTLGTILGFILWRRLKGVSYPPNVHNIKEENIHIVEELGRDSSNYYTYRVTCASHSGRKHLCMDVVQGLTRKEQASLVRQIALQICLPAHLNVIQGIGVCQSRGSHKFLYELCDGSLKSYLEENDSITERILTLAEIIKFMVQVADGLCFLHEQNVLHNDLSLQNIMYQRVDSGIICKIHNFKLSQKARKCKCDHCPITAAPETLSSGWVSKSSDVWLYGSTIIQILYYGAEQWTTMDKLEIYEAVCDNGQVLRPPEETPSSLQQLIAECFTYEPEERPKMATVRMRLGALIKDMQQFNQTQKLWPKTVSVEPFMPRASMFTNIEPQNMINDEPSTSRRRPVFKTTISRSFSRQSSRAPMLGTPKSRPNRILQRLRNMLGTEKSRAPETVEVPLELFSL